MMGITSKWHKFLKMGVPKNLNYQIMNPATMWGYNFFIWILVQNISKAKL
jgi:hypothetical protein